MPLQAGCSSPWGDVLHDLAVAVGRDGDPKHSLFSTTARITIVALHKVWEGGIEKTRSSLLY